MRTLTILLVLAGAAHAQARAVRPQEPADPGRPIPKKEKAAADVSVRGGTELAYDDNILDLSNRQIDQLESGTRPEKYRIDEAADFVAAPWAEIRLKGRLFQEPTTAGLKIQPYFYQDSSIANYEEYTLFVKQDLGRHEAGFEYGLERDVYLRELEIVVPGPNLWESAYYDEHDLEVHTKHALPSSISVRPFLGYRYRDFESPFDFRDRGGLFLGIEPAADLGRGLKAFFRYEYADLEAEASSTDPDTSFREHEFEVGSSLALLEERMELSLRYRVGLREYTTSNDPAIDPSHADREDTRRRFIARVRAKLSKGWELEARYEYRHVDSHRPFDDDATTSEPGDSTRNLFLIGLTLSR